MRTPARKHVLCVLREILGLTQKQLGQLIGASRPTIQAIELERLPLSDHMAHRVSEETGVSVHWLKANDLVRRPVNRYRQRYTRKDFNLAQSDAFRGTYLVELMPLAVVLNAYAKLRAIVEALNFNEATGGLFPFKLEMLILELEDCITDQEARKKYYKERQKSRAESMDDIIELIRADMAHIIQAKKDLEIQTEKTGEPSKLEILVPNYPNVLHQRPMTLREVKPVEPENRSQ